jgi:hypothetical protein
MFAYVIFKTILHYNNFVLNGFMGFRLDFFVFLLSDAEISKYIP